MTTCRLRAALLLAAAVPLAAATAAALRAGHWHKLADFGMNGAFHLDSAWHHGWETVAALVATTKGDHPMTSRTRLDTACAGVRAPVCRA